MANHELQKDPLVSVLIPAYNAEPYVAKAITSVLRQSESDFELIVVDDASSDDTVRHVEAFDDPRINLIRQQTNRGAQATRNRAMAHARGEWIAFLDADDWFAPFRLERLLLHARSSGADIVADNVFRTAYDLTLTNAQGLFIDRFGQVAMVPRLFEGAFLRSLPRMIDAVEFMEGHRPGPRNPCFGLMKPLFNRAFLEAHELRWDERVRYSQDTVFYLSCLVAGARFFVTPEAGYFYRTDSDGISGSADMVEATRHRLEVNRHLIELYGSRDPQLQRVLLRRERRLKRMIAFLTYERARQHANGSALKTIAQHPRDTLDVASYWLERSFWRGVGRIRSIPRRLQALQSNRENASYVPDTGL